MSRPHITPLHYRRSMTGFATKTICLDDIQGVAIPGGAAAAYEYLTSDAWLGRSCAGCSKPMDGSGHEYDEALVMHDAAGKTLDWHLTCWDDAPSEVRGAHRESARVIQCHPIRMAWLYHSCTVCGWACVGCKCIKRGLCEHPSHDH